MAAFPPTFLLSGPGPLYSPAPNGIPPRPGPGAPAPRRPLPTSPHNQNEPTQSRGRTMDDGPPVVFGWPRPACGAQCVLHRYGCSRLLVVMSSLRARYRTRKFVALSPWKWCPCPCSDAVLRSVKKQPNQEDRESNKAKQEDYPLDRQGGGYSTMGRRGAGWSAALSHLWVPGILYNQHELRALHVEHLDSACHNLLPAGCTRQETRPA